MKSIFLTICITLGLLLSCTKKELPASSADLKKSEDVVVPISSVSTPMTSQTLQDDLDLAKTLAGQIRFIASLEKEVLKLILENSAPDVNQFEVLGYGFDKFNGAKTGFLAGFGCQKIAVRAGVKKFEIFSDCTKPSKKLAEINQDVINKNKFTAIFLTANWKVILGNAAGINPDRVCEFTLENKKVQTLDCQDTVFSPRFTTLDINLYELKIKKYTFNRNQAQELVIEGGHFKDLIETKKINLTVPMTGKISVIEKEIKIKDDFTDLQNKLLGLEEKKEETKDGQKEESRNEQDPKEEGSEKALTAEPEYIATESASSTEQNSQEQNEQQQQPEQPSAPYER